MLVKPPVLKGYEAVVRGPDADELWLCRAPRCRAHRDKTPQIRLRPTPTTWASISTAGRLTLNTERLALTKPLGERRHMLPIHVSGSPLVSSRS
jgi:hypothetical protein